MFGWPAMIAAPGIYHEHKPAQSSELQLHMVTLPLPWLEVLQRDLAEAMKHSYDEWDQEQIVEFLMAGHLTLWNIFEDGMRVGFLLTERIGLPGKARINIAYAYAPNRLAELLEQCAAHLEAYADSVQAVAIEWTTKRPMDRLPVLERAGYERAYVVMRKKL